MASNELTDEEEALIVALDEEVVKSCPRIPLRKKYEGSEFLCKGCPWHLKNAEPYLNCSLVAWDFGTFTIQQIAEMMQESYATIEGIFNQGKKNVFKQVYKLSENDEFRREMFKRTKLK